MTAGEVIKCKAAVAWEAAKPLSIEDIEVAPPKAGEVRIKMISTGVCFSDELTRSGNDPVGRFPCILGHEGGGIVESVGEGVTSVEAGDHVIPLYIAQCYECDACKSKKTNLCIKVLATQFQGLMPDGTTRFTCKGEPVYHFMGCSTFSQYTVVAEVSVVKIDNKAPLERACLLGCGITTGYGAALNAAPVEAGSTVAVIGLGCVGLAAIMGAAKAGAKRIIGIDVNPAKEAIAKELGATELVNPLDYPDRPLHEVMIEKTGGGLDYTFECVGNVDLMRSALDMCRQGGGVSTIVGLAPAGKEISAVPFQLITGRVWKGCAFGGYKSKDNVPNLVSQYLDGDLEVDKFVTATYPLEEINTAFEAMRIKEPICIRSTVSLF